MSLPIAIPEFVKKIPRRKPRAAAPDAVGGEPLAPAAEPTSAADRADVESPPAGRSAPPTPLVLLMVAFVVATVVLLALRGRGGDPPNPPPA